MRDPLLADIVHNFNSYQNQNMKLKHVHDRVCPFRKRHGPHLKKKKNSIDVQSATVLIHKQLFNSEMNKK